MERARVRDAGRRWGRGVGVVSLAAIVVFAACGDDDSGTGASETTDATEIDESVLGQANPATGEPVRIGLVSHGRTPSLDNQIELDVADATIAWLNEYRGGMGGRPIELVTCIDNGDPARAADCGNRMVEEDVAAVVTASHAQVESVFEPLDGAGVPVMMYGGTSETILADTDNAFTLADPTASQGALPLAVAEDVGADKVTAVVIDVPAALEPYQGDVLPQLYEDAGVELEVVPVPLGTADMTPQMQTIASDDPGVVSVLGNDSFCIAAFQGLEAVGYDGEIAAITQCLSDTTRTAVSSEVLEGMHVAATAPVGADNPSSRLYEAVVETFGNGDIDITRTTGYSTFTVVAALAAALEGLEGEATHENVISTIESMPEKDLPAGGGLTFRCDRKTLDFAPAGCVKGGLATVLDSEGQPTEYEVIGTEEAAG